MVERVALYLRSSKDRHDVSIDAQQRELSEFVTRQGDIIVRTYEDKVESAKTDDRPGFQSMISDVQRPDCDFKRIYCYDTSRFSRRQHHAQMYKHLLKKKGVELLFLKLPKTDSILDPVVESLMEIFDEFHSQKSKMDGLRGMRENVKQGWRAGGRAVYGYKLDKQVVGTREGLPVTKSKLVPCPKSFDKMKAYLKARATGRSRGELIQDLNLEVSNSVLGYAERNVETYAGHTVWNKTNEKLDGEYLGGKKYRDRSEWVIHRNTHEAMITDDEAARISEIQKRHQRSRARTTKSGYLLANVLKCTCGANYQGDSGYYRCGKRCGAKGIKKETIEQVVIDYVIKDFLKPQDFVQLKKSIKKLIAERSNNQQSKSARLQEAIKEIDGEINDLVKLVAQMKQPRPILERIDSLETDRSAVQKELDALPTEVNPEFIELSDRKVREFITRYIDDFTQGDYLKKKSLVRSLIEVALFDGHEVTITPTHRAVTGYTGTENETSPDTAIIGVRKTPKN